MESPPTVVNVTKAGTARVLNGEKGQTFFVHNAFYREATLHLAAGWVVAVRDYRFPHDGRPFQTWSLSPGDYEIVV